MESGVDRFVSPKDPRSWVGLVTKPRFCWYGPPVTWRYLSCPSGPVIRMLCVIAMSTREGVKTQLVREGQAFNTLEDLQFSLRGSWTYNLSTSAKFMSLWPMENIPEAHHSGAANPVCKHFILQERKKRRRNVSVFPSIFFQSWNLFEMADVWFSSLASSFLQFGHLFLLV